MLIVLLRVSDISSLLQKSHFPIEIALNSLQIGKGLELAFQVAFFVEVLDKIFSFVI